MATDRERNIKDTFDAVLAFDAVHKTEYVAITSAAAQMVILNTENDGLETAFATQSSGDASMAVEQKKVLKISAKRRMKSMAKTAGGVGQTIPGLEKTFKMPASDTDLDVVARGREMAEAATTYATQFTALGSPPSKTTELSDILDQIDAANTAKATGEAAKVGATAAVGDHCETGMAAIDVFDVIMENFYEDNPATLAEWRSAKHVKRAPKKTPPPPGPANPAPPGP